MENPNLRLVAYGLLMTLGLVILLTGIPSLLLFGMALSILAACFSSRRRFGARSVIAFIVLTAVALREFFLRPHRGDAFTRESMPLTLWVALLAVWLWAILAEFYKWRKNRAALITPNLNN
jgi:hypothetical protein